MPRRKRKQVTHAVGFGPGEAADRAGRYFAGELMRCCLCAAQERSDPARETDWRLLEADGEAFYFCPAHFPPDGAGVEDFRIAYDTCLRRICEIRALRAESRGTP